MKTAVTTTSRAAQELEAHITDCGRLMREAMATGDRAAAYKWLRAQNAAIRARTPEQVKAMEIERGLDHGCYFHEMGKRHALMLQTEQGVSA